MHWPLEIFLTFAVCLQCTKETKTLVSRLPRLRFYPGGRQHGLQNSFSFFIQNYNVYTSWLQENIPRKKEKRHYGEKKALSMFAMQFFSSRSSSLSR